MPIQFNTTNRKVIYYVDINLSTNNFSETIDQIYTIIYENEEAGNWIKSADISAQADNQYADISIRVKTSDLNNFMSKLPTAGIITSQKINSTDVTYNYATIEAQIEALIAEKGYYETLLEGNVNTTYINRINQLNQQISLLTDQLVKYDSEVEYSTVNIKVKSYTDAVEPEPEPEPVKKSFWRTIKDIFIGSVSFLWTIIKGITIAIVAVAPFAAVAGLVLLGYYIYNKKIKGYFKKDKDKLDK